MFALQDQNACDDLKPAPALYLLPDPANDYGWLVREFEEMAELLLQRVERMIEEAVRDHRMSARERWQAEARFLAAELHRFPWLITHIPCPPSYGSLSLLYREWALSCEMLALDLKALARLKGRDPLALRRCEEKLVAVTDEARMRRSLSRRSSCR